MRGGFSHEVKAWQRKIGAIWGLCFGLVVLPWYVLAVLSVLNVIPFSVCVYIVLPTILYGFRVHSWARYRGWGWWKEIMLIPLGFVGWLIVRLDVPNHLDPRYISEYEMILQSGVYGICDESDEVYAKEKPGLLLLPFALLVDVLIFVWCIPLEWLLGLRNKEGMKWKR